MHLAQINVGRLIAPLDDPKIAGFVARFDEINALGERSPGFVWRLKDDSGNSASIRAFDDPSIIVNMSVWDSVESLRQYAYYSRHADVFRDRAKWFEPPKQAHMALWQVPEGHIPTLDEGVERLEHVRTHGPSSHAFTFKTALQFLKNPDPI